MKVGTCLILIFLQSCQSYHTNNNDAALILSRLLAEDYQNQDVGPEEDYSYYQYIQPAIKPPAGYDLESYQNTQDAAPHQENLKFPELLPHQKQFAVNPSSAVFDEKNPDFLQYRLEAIERTNHPELKSSDLDFQKQLLEAMDSRREEDLGSGPDKRGMLGEPRAMPVISDNFDEDISEDFFFTSIVAGAAAASVFVVLGAGYCYHRSAVRSKQQEDVEYPAYGVTGPAKASSPGGDRKLAQSAQMYHYQHQKNQMISINRPGAASGPEEESEGEGEGEEGDYTVCECPGLAWTDEMEVKNPLFNDDPTPKNQ